MSYSLVCFDKSHYTTYAEAKTDQAVSQTGSTMDDLEGSWSGVYDLLEVQHMVNERLGRNVNDMIVFGVVNNNDVFFSLDSLTAIRDLNQGSMGECCDITDIVG